MSQISWESPLFAKLKEKRLKELMNSIRKSSTQITHPLLDISSIKRSPLPIIYHDSYSVEPWPKNHSFRMPKFKLLFQHLSENNFNFDNLHHPTMPSDEDISIAHSMNYIDAITRGDQSAYKSVNLIYSDALQQRAKISLNGTLKACELALRHGIACQISGGYHHAHFDHGTGFCIFNDLAYSALHLLANNEKNGVRNICILDLDVHQGDGTASILENVSNVLTVSAHCESNFPFVKQKSDIDVSLPDNMNDCEYLDKIKDLMSHLIQNKHKGDFPIDLVIYDGGVDVHEKDKLGRLKITDDGLIKRDNFVFDTCIKNDIAIACVIGGGYDVDDNVLAQRHGFMHWNALKIWNKYNLG